MTWSRKIGGIVEMKEVCAITGGGSGMGLVAAKYLPKEKCIILTGRTVSTTAAAPTEKRV